MSLINDALRRASQGDRNRPPPGGPTEGMKPAPDPANWVLLAVLAAAVFMMFVGAVWFFWHALAMRPVYPAPPATVIGSSPPSKPAPSPAPATPVQPAAAEIATPPPPVRLGPPPYPPLKLQGIFYSRSNPCALINGQTVQEGVTLTGVTIQRIEPSQVTVQWNGQVKVLKMNLQ